MPTAEVFPNTAIGFLNGGITSSATSITLQSGHTFPAGGNFMVKIDNELIQFTGVATNVATAVRAQEGTTGASHTDGAVVFGVITKGALGRLVGQMHGGTLETQRPNLNFVDGGGVTWTLTDDSGNNACDISASAGVPGITVPPVLADWTWVNQGSANAYDLTGGGITLIGSVASGDNNQMLVRTLTGPPYTVIAGFRLMLFAGTFPRVGMAIRDSVSGKIVMWGFLDGAGFNIVQYSSPTAHNSDPVENPFTVNNMTGRMWMKIQDNSTNRLYSISPDGANWIQIYSEASNTYLTPNEAGITVNSNSASLPPANITLDSWLITNP